MYRPAARARVPLVVLLSSLVVVLVGGLVPADAATAARDAARQPVPVPMLISTDQEQGIVTRVGPPATQFPGNMALGADGSVGDAAEAAWITGTEIRAIGINQDYAPVSDVNVNPANPVI